MTTTSIPESELTKGSSPKFLCGQLVMYKEKVFQVENMHYVVNKGWMYNIREIKKGTRE